MGRSAHRTRAAATALFTLALILISTVSGAQAQDEPNIWVTACDISDPQALTSEQAACVAALTASFIGEDRTFLDLPPVETPNLVGGGHGCHGRNIEPSWPIDEAGNIIALNVARAIVEVSYTARQDGSVARADAQLIEPEATGFPDGPAFLAAAVWAVERWRLCENDEVTHGVAQFIFRMDESAP
ncbi:hypothetical protein SAMN04488568_10118 [Maricaulis salignorans]|uniref:TonB protein C-terminal n=1 Tax=Maricaulis salignorans TaxID=144026 RepID=A0A1G9LEW4_9PROT|nr:hypothetical protein SAMN04488568_10118 [Maricaulis salignorans]